MSARTILLPIAVLACLGLLVFAGDVAAQQTPTRPAAVQDDQKEAAEAEAPPPTGAEEGVETEGEEGPEQPAEEVGEEPEEAVEEEAPEQPPTAAERFAELPRFGADVFTQPERPETEGEPAQRPAPAAMAQEGAAIAAVPPTYIIGPGDELAVRVWTDAIEHIKASPVVDAEGRVYLELLGEVTVAGESLAEVRERIAQRYRAFFNRAEISVGLARTRVIEVRVTGDAVRPGKYQLYGDATLFSALYAAGGPNEIGSLRAIKLLRRGQDPIVIDLYRYLLYGDISGDVPLRADDTIFIPPAGVTVGVAGEVRRPARYELLEDTTLAQALEMAAGIRATGYAHNVELWRVGESGRRELLNVDIRQDGDLRLRDGDLIVVTPVLETPENVVELIGAVERPGSYQVRPGMTIRDLLAVAQGLSETAHTEQAELWRLNEDLDYELIPGLLTSRKM